MRKNKRVPLPHDFDRWGAWIAKKISSAAEAEEADEAMLLRETVWGAAAFYAYKYIALIDDEGLGRALALHVGARPGPRPSTSLLVFRLVEGHHQNGKLLSPTRRSRLASGLEIARSFGVSPDLILGFLSEMMNQRTTLEVYHDRSMLRGLEAYVAQGRFSPK